MPFEAVNRKNNFKEVLESKNGGIRQFPGTVHGEEIAFSLTDCVCHEPERESISLHVNFLIT